MAIQMPCPDVKSHENVHVTLKMKSSLSLNVVPVPNVGKGQKSW